MTLIEAEKLKIGDEVRVKKAKKILKISNMWYQSHTLKVFRLSDGRMYEHTEIMKADL